MWDLPEPGIKPVSPAFTGGFLFTGPLGKDLFLAPWWENTHFFFFGTHTLSHSPASIETNAEEGDKELVWRTGIIFHGGWWGLQILTAGRKFMGSAPGSTPLGG